MLREVLDVATAISLVGWFVAAVFAQRINSTVLKYDYLGLLPDFRFFAPRPASRDICLYVRGLPNSGEWSPWHAVYSQPKRWWCFLWNPQHRPRKAVFDLFQELEHFREAPEVWHVSAPYLAFLNVATAEMAKIGEVSRVQFMIACYAGFEEATHDILFLSHAHRV